MTNIPYTANCITSDRIATKSSPIPENNLHIGLYKKPIIIIIINNNTIINETTASTCWVFII